jgi:hypothetical protein
MPLSDLLYGIAQPAQLLADRLNLKLRLCSHLQKRAAGTRAARVLRSGDRVRPLREPRSQQPRSSISCRELVPTHAPGSTMNQPPPTSAVTCTKTWRLLSAFQDASTGICDGQDVSKRKITTLWVRSGSQASRVARERGVQHRPVLRPSLLDEVRLQEEAGTYRKERLGELSTTPYPPRSCSRRSKRI